MAGDETILVVEDEAEVAAIASAFLRSLGYQVRIVAGEDDAMTVLRSEPKIALLFTDLMLGIGGSGLELAQQARALRPDLPVLLTSGYADPTQAPSLGDGASFELLRKPYRREQLGEAIRRNLDRRTN